jgi:gas vesicle protein
MSSGKVALGLLAAAATGAVLGVLFAPAKGAVLRRKIRSVGEKEMDGMKEKLSDVVDDLSQKYEKVKHNVSDFSHQRMNKATEVKTAESN